MRGVPRWFAVLCVVAFAGLVCAFSLRHALAPPILQVRLSHAALSADGVTTAELKLESSGGPFRDLNVESDDPRRIAVESVIVHGREAMATLRAGVMPGTTGVRVSAAGVAPHRIDVTARLDTDDSFGDGTPDFLRLHDPADRSAFRAWFTAIAESQYFRAAKLPHEIDDCAALLRFSYRETLRQHDSAWAGAMSLPRSPRAGELRQYHYPYTPLGASIFRVREGSFTGDDLSNGGFAEFADAKTLWRDNAYIVGRELARARPGDLLFFRQSGHDMPFHAMIFLGSTETSSEAYVVYHTGPQGKSPGEIRRLSVKELMNYPDARWRPVPSNRAFLGVYRWNILREDE